MGILGKIEQSERLNAVPEAVNGTQGGHLVKDERESTKLAKARFLAIFDQVGGLSVRLATQKAGISRDTYYRWLRTDQVFHLRINEVRRHIEDFVEDMLLMKIFQGDGASIRFYLSRRHPDYMARNRNNNSRVQSKTLEDLIDEGNFGL